MQVTTVGIDLAKNGFQLHGCDARGKTVLTAATSGSKFHGRCGGPI